MKALASFAFDGQCYRCQFASPAEPWITPLVVSNPRFKRILVVANFAELPRPGQYCKRPHEWLAKAAAHV